MKKYKVLKDFQYTDSNKKIVSIKKNTIILDYVYSDKSGEYKIDKDIIDNNIDYFEEIDFNKEFLMFIKSSKISQPSVVYKKLLPFIEEYMNVDNSEVIIREVVKEVEIKDIESETKMLYYKGELESVNKILEGKNSDVSNLLEKLKEKELEINNMLSKGNSDEFLKGELLGKNETILELNKKVDILSNNLLEKDSELISLNSLKNITIEENNKLRNDIDELITKYNIMESKYNEYMNSFNGKVEEKIKEFESRIPYQYRRSFGNS